MIQKSFNELMIIAFAIHFGRTIHILVPKPVLFHLYDLIFDKIIKLARAYICLS